MIKDLKGDTSFNFEELLVLRCLPPVECRKWLISKATKGAGTTEKYLIDAVAPCNNEEIIELYQNDPQSITNILNDVSVGNFAKLLRLMLKGQRAYGIDDSSADTIAEQLYKAGEGRLGTDESVFNNVFASQGPTNLHRIDHYYQQKHKHHGLEKAVKGETSGHYEDLLVACLKEPLIYYADRCSSAIKGLGTDEHALNYIFGLLDLHQLKEVAQIYHQRHSHSLADDVKGDTSGHYRDLLISLLQN